MLLGQQLVGGEIMGEQDDAARDLLSAFQKRPFAVAVMAVSVALVFLSAGLAWESIKTDTRELRKDLVSVSDRINSAQVDQKKLETRVERVEEKAAEKLEQVQRDLSDVKAVVRGIDASLQIIIRQNASPPPR